MPIPFKVVVDCADPHMLSRFWALALGWVVEDHSALVQALLGQGVVGEDDTITAHGLLGWRHAAAVRDPDGPVDPQTGIGQGGRVLFQVVPEPKPGKNRVHLDLHVGPERRDEHVEFLLAHGATKLWDGSQGPNTWQVLADPEGNEFCVA